MDAIRPFRQGGADKVPPCPDEWALDLTLEGFIDISHRSDENHFFVGNLQRQKTHGFKEGNLESRCKDIIPRPSV